MKRRQEAAEEAERQRLQAEQDARAAAEAEAAAARQSRDSHDAPGSPQRDSGNYRHITTHQYIIAKCTVYIKLWNMPPFASLQQTIYIHTTNNETKIWTSMGKTNTNPTKTMVYLTFSCCTRTIISHVVAVYSYSLKMQNQIQNSQHFSTHNINQNQIKNGYKM